MKLKKVNEGVYIDKEDRPLTRHAKFMIKELSATLKCLEKADFTDELKEEMRNLSQEMINANDTIR
jgi:hypothetical protein